MSIASLLNMSGLGFALSLGQNIQEQDFKTLIGVPVPDASLLTNIFGNQKSNSFSLGPALSGMAGGAFTPMTDAALLSNIFAGTSQSPFSMAPLLGDLGMGGKAGTGLGSFMPDLNNLLDQVYKSVGSMGSLSSLMGGFDPQSLVNLATPNGAVNAPGKGGKGKSFNSTLDFLNISSGLNPKQNNMLAFNSGSFANQISGIQFTAFDPAKILAQFPGLVA